MKRNLEKTYDPKSFEKRLYKDWEENGCTTHEQQFIHADPVRWEYDCPEDYPF